MENMNITKDQYGLMRKQNMKAFTATAVKLKHKNHYGFVTKKYKENKYQLKKFQLHFNKNRIPSFS